MLDLLIIILGVAGGIMLASGVMLIIMLQPGFAKWYTKQTNKMIDVLANITEKMEDQ